MADDTPLSPTERADYTRVLREWDAAMDTLPAEHQPANVARILADDYVRHAQAIIAESELSRRPFIVDWPALARWRTRVLADRRKHAPDVVAAALECLALECHLSGQPELAAKATQQAERVVIEYARRAGARVRSSEFADAHD